MPLDRLAWPIDGRRAVDLPWDCRDVFVPVPFPAPPFWLALLKRKRPKSPPPPIHRAHSDLHPLANRIGDQSHHCLLVVVPEPQQGCPRMRHAHFDFEVCSSARGLHYHLFKSKISLSLRAQSTHKLTRAAAHPRPHKRT